MLNLKNRKGRRYSRNVHPRFSSKKRLKRRWLRALIPLLLACAVVVALLQVAVDYLTHYGKIYQGVSVGGVDLGGKTPEEARNMLEEQTGSRLMEITLSGPKEEFTIPSKDLGVNITELSTDT